MRRLISMGVSWKILSIHGCLVPEKWILVAFGTEVPARYVTVKLFKYTKEESKDDSQ